MIRKESNTDIILLLHFIVGAVFGLFPQAVLYFTLIAFLFFVYNSIRKPDQAQYAAAYIIGLEMLMRMSRSGIPHEFAKYAICVVLLAGILKKRIVPVPIIFYGLLQVPAFFLADGGTLEETRQLISFNFSGPLCLIFSVIYFYNKPVDVFSLKKIFVNMLYPIAAMLGFMTIRTPAIEQVHFGFRSNFATSGYGPNQVASVIGLVILILGFAYLFKIKLFRSYITFFALLILASYRGLLTFSRGGMITPIIIFAIIIIYIYFGAPGYRFKLKLFFCGCYTFFYCLSVVRLRK